MDNSTEAKVLGYDIKGNPISKKGNLLTSCCIECKGCGRLLSNDGGPKKIYCEDCAKKEGLLKTTS